MGRAEQYLSRWLGNAVLEPYRREELPVFEDCNQATTIGGCGKLRKLLWVTVICAELIYL
jgi:hypothetical protein